MELFDDDGSGDDSKIEIDEEYAKRYEYNKKREDLHRYEEMKKKGLIEDSDESSESEDDYEEDDELLSSKKDVKFLNALIRIKKKDPILKDEGVKLFDSESDESDGGEGADNKKRMRKGERKLYLKDVIAKQALEGEGEPDDKGLKRKDEGFKKVKSLAEEQEEARKAILEVTEAAVGDDDEEEFLKFKESGGDQGEMDEEEVIVQRQLDEYFGSDDELDENSKYLKEFFGKKLYLDKIEEKPIEEELKNLSESEDEELDKEINYRFEENAGDRVLGHSRVVEGSVRKKVSARKAQRLSKEQRRAIAEEERMEEVKHLKTLKKQEFMEKLKKVKEIGGLDGNAASALDEDDLEEDFDPEKYDKKMKQLYGDNYYGAEDVDPDFGSDEEGDYKPDFDKEDELLGLPKGWDQQYKEELNGENTYEEELKEALYELDYEDAIGDLKTRFKYTKVKPQRFGLSQEEILELDDNKLNQYVSLKKIAPYREKEWKVPSMKKFQFKQELKEQLNAGTSGGDIAKKRKRLQENVASSGSNNDALKDEAAEAFNASDVTESKKNRKKRQKEERKMSQSRLLAYGKIPSKSKTKQN